LRLPADTPRYRLTEAETLRDAPEGTLETDPEDTEKDRKTAALSENFGSAAGIFVLCFLTFW